jgi:ribosomal-protein-alanine N-acetyltransferase
MKASPWPACRPDDGAAAHLRPWTADESDVSAVLGAFGAADMRRQAAGQITTRQAALDWLTGMVPGAGGSARAFAIDLGGVGGVVGAVGHVMVSGIDGDHQTGWVSYWVAPGHRGRGLAAAAAAGLARHCFDDLDLFRLELGHRTNNPASGAVASAAGFRPEGIERAKLRYPTAGGGWERHDVARWSRLASDPAPRAAPLPLG